MEYLFWLRWTLLFAVGYVVQLYIDRGDDTSIVRGVKNELFHSYEKTTRDELRELGAFIREAVRRRFKKKSLRGALCLEAFHIACALGFPLSFLPFSLVGFMGFVLTVAGLMCIITVKNVFSNAAHGKRADYFPWANDFYIRHHTELICIYAMHFLFLPLFLCGGFFLTRADALATVRIDSWAGPAADWRSTVRNCRVLLALLLPFELVEPTTGFSFVVSALTGTPYFCWLGSLWLEIINAVNKDCYVCHKPLWRKRMMRCKHCGRFYCCKECAKIDKPNHHCGEAKPRGEPSTPPRRRRHEPAPPTVQRRRGR